MLTNFLKQNKKAKYDVAIIRSKDTAVVTTGTALMIAMDYNRNLGRNFKDVMDLWQRIPDQYTIYDGLESPTNTTLKTKTKEAVCLTRMIRLKLGN